MEDKNSFRKTVAVMISNKNIDKWENISEITPKTVFVSTIVNNYLSEKYIEVDLPEEILNKFKNDVKKTYIVNELLTEYYKGNIVYLDQMKKSLEIQKSLNISVSNAINNSDKNDIQPLEEESKNIFKTIEKVEYKEEISLDTNEKDNNIGEIVSVDNDDSLINSSENIEDINKVEEKESTKVKSVEDNPIDKFDDDEYARIFLG
ncbi:MAG: hypothetical protein E7E64_04795 [Clostridium celatum]|uniref:hypothetical protein n=1 Tax=Clostridium tertium TaxID=1559 RepID=UPI0029052BCB|nr:hypothetical protein [Clostridium celatum]